MTATRSRLAGGLEKSSTVLLFALIALSPIALGSVHPVTRTVVVLAAALLLLLTLVHRHMTEKRLVVTVPLLVLSLAVVVTALQLVPLPAGLLARLSPMADDTLRATQPEYSSNPLTLDRAGTVVELAKLAGYAAFFAAAVTYASRAHRRRAILFAIAIVTTVVVVLGLAQALIDPRHVLFFYTPEAEFQGLVVRGTFVNANHFGALLSLGAPCVLVLTLHERKHRPWLLASLVLIIVAAVLSISRSTIVTLPLALLATWLLDQRVSTRSRSRSSTESGGASRDIKLAIVVAVAAAIAVAITIGATTLGAEVAQTERNELGDPLGRQSKFRLWGDAAELIGDYPWTGHGRGAFEQAFTRVSNSAGVTRYHYVENGYLQAAADWGVPFALLLAVLAGWSFLLAIPRVRSEPLLGGALVALVTLALHETVDFSVEVPGIALPALALLATLFGRSSRERLAASRTMPVRWWFYTAPVAVLTALAFSSAVTPARAEAKVLLERARDPQVPTAEIVSTAEAMLRRHPADFFLVMIVAKRLAEAHDPQAISWLNRALYLSPQYPVGHMMAAELLAASNRRSQALLEYRLAARYSNPPELVWERVHARFPDAQDLMATSSDDPVALERLANFIARKGDYQAADVIYQKALAEAPGSISIRRMLVRSALALKQYPSALARARALVAADRSIEAQRLLANALIGSHELTQAAKLLDELRDRSIEGFNLELALANTMAETGDLAGCRARLDRLTWQGDIKARARLHEARALLERRAGNIHQAEWESNEALQLKKKQR